MEPEESKPVEVPAEGGENEEKTTTMAGPLRDQHGEPFRFPGGVKSYGGG